MQELDFSGINKIAYKGFESAEERDSLLQAGFTVANPTDNPFLAPERPSEQPQASAPVIIPGNMRAASERKVEAFTDYSGERNYKRMYRIAHDFHQRHNPPTVERDYWKDHTPGEDEVPEAEERYWIEAAKDVAETSAAGGNDPFLMGLLTEIYTELEREYKAIRAKSTLKPSKTA